MDGARRRMTKMIKEMKMLLTTDNNNSVVIIALGITAAISCVMFQFSRSTTKNLEIDNVISETLVGASKEETKDSDDAMMTMMKMGGRLPTEADLPKTRRTSSPRRTPSQVSPRTPSRFPSTRSSPARSPSRLSPSRLSPSRFSPSRSDRFLSFQSNKNIDKKNNLLTNVKRGTKLKYQDKQSKYKKMLAQRMPPTLPSPEKSKDSSIGRASPKNSPRSYNSRRSQSSPKNSPTTSSLKNSPRSSNSATRGAKWK